MILYLREVIFYFVTGNSTRVNHEILQTIGSYIKEGKNLKMKMKKNWYCPIHLLILLFLVFLFPLSAQASSVTISKSSATIQVGKSVTLKVLNNGNSVSDVFWGSSDSSVASVSQKGKVLGKSAGSTVITAMYNGNTVECVVSVVKATTNQTVRYNVLLLDCSGSMKGAPLKRAKTAAKRFSQTVLSANGTNYVAVVTLNSSSKVLCDFTNSQTTINKAINSMTASGNTNMQSAFANANRLLKDVPTKNGIMKNVILCSDGLPKSGQKLSSGKYSSSDHKYYKYANAVYKLDKSMKNSGHFIYALGFFHNSSGTDLIFGKRLMKDLASKDKYYLIQDTKDINQVFDKIATQITSLTLSEQTLSMYAGDTKTLTSYVDGAAQDASWKSTKKSVASVSQKGKITAKKPGTATIQATIGKQTVSCKVTVKTRPSLKLNKNSAELQVNQTLQLKATVTGDSKTVSWKSGNTDIATVTSSGKVTGKKAGTVTITASCNGISANCKVTVTKLKDITSKLTLYGDAVKLDDGSIRLTECTTWQAGSVWYSNPISTKKGFTASFQYWAGGGRDQSFGGADGIVLNIARQTGIGASGQDLGFAGDYGIELDSYYNSGLDPIDAKHIAIIHNNIYTNLCYRADDRVDDSKWHTVKVVYKNQTLKMYLDGKLMLTGKGVLLESQVYLGISAATGGGINAHYIRKFKIS